MSFMREDVVTTGFFWHPFVGCVMSPQQKQASTGRRNLGEWLLELLLLPFWVDQGVKFISNNSMS